MAGPGFPYWQQVLASQDHCPIQSQRATYASKPPFCVLYQKTDMLPSEKGKKSLRSRLLHATIPTSGFRNRSPSPSLSQRVTSTEFATRVFARQTAQLGFIPPPDMSEHQIANLNTSVPLANRAPSTDQAPSITESPASDGRSDNFNLQDNLYAAIGGLPITVVPATQIHQMGSAAYEGLKTVLQGLYDCSDMFLPLKTAAGGLLTIFRIVDVRVFEA